MKTCVQCRGTAFHTVEREEVREVAGRRFIGSLPVLVCDDCGTGYTPVREGAAFERLAAARLAEEGPMGAESFRFMRKALGLRASELGELLGVSPYTISRWETGAAPVPRLAWVTLGGLVLDAVEGRDSTRRRLDNLGKGESPPHEVHLTAGSRASSS